MPKLKIGWENERVMPGEHMLNCLRLNLHRLPAVAKRVHMPLKELNAVLAGGRLSRAQWLRVAELFRLER